MRLENVLIKSKLAMLSGLFLAGLGSFAYVAFDTLDQVKIGSAAYKNITITSESFSDFVPPTQYVMKERLDLMTMRADADDKDKLSDEIDDFKALTIQFEKGHAQWLIKITDPTERALMQKVYLTGHDYLDVALNNFIPLLQQCYFPGAYKLRFTEMKMLFGKHAMAAKEFIEAMREQIAANEKSAQDMVAGRTFSLALVALVAETLVLVLCRIIGRGILTPLDATVSMLHEVSQGNLMRRIEVRGVTDEIAQMGMALNETVGILSRVILDINSNAQALATASEHLSVSSQRLGASSHQTTIQAAAVSSAAEQVSQSVQTVSCATEEMSSSIKEISRSASEAAEVASSAARLAGTTTATMTKLSESSR